ncbi:ABC transporter substrate-binding protein [Thalassotalea sp. PP2-459]|uniref:substrate-binding periplasmic protein n=1 Tax=Thalassotalea sp. PP2-459 TaxID=1742724 RepID=UPI000945B4CA|nr:transporter substrate-binding domain-containing protein [Thalassotalea sp. PP2-459]OKY25801.1 hypothetical protein BI291_14420 [Thalassotalea sp. PP2-459]
MNIKIFIAITATLLCLSNASANTKSILAVGWELWYPYQYHNNQHELVGLDIEIFNKIVKKAGYNIAYTELPWKRHLQYIKMGKMDIAMGASLSKDRTEYAYFTKPYRKEQVKLYVRKGTRQNIILNSLADLSKSNYMIGVEGGYYYGKLYKKLILQAEFRAHISEVIDLEENVKQTLKGHLDGFLVDPVTMRAFVEKYKLFNEFEEHPVEIYQDEIYLMLSKSTMNEDDLARFNDAIESLQQSGELFEINQQWTSLQASKR